jgi:hypothetical protein
MPNYQVSASCMANVATISSIENENDNSTVAQAQPNVSKKDSFGAKDYIFIAILVFMLALIVYMLKALRKPQSYATHSVDEFAKKRQDAGLPATDQDADNQADEFLENAFNCWSVVSNPGEDELRSPLKMKQILSSTDWINKAIELNPTRETTVNRMNELGNILNDRESRKFDGSWKLIICAAIFSVIIILFQHGIWGKLYGTFVTLIPIALYYLSSLTPVFLIEKRQRWTQGFNLSNVLIVTVLSLIATTPATETWITHWSDGSKTKSEELNPIFVIWMILAAILVIVLGLFISVIALLNFIRNYLLYF